MKLGIVLPQTEMGADPQAILRFVGTAEAAGFSYVAVYEHVLGAERRSHPNWQSNYDSGSLFHEPFLLFGFLAPRTGLDLVTAVLALPQRQTALVAKQAAEVDILSGGRFRMGVGLGWNRVEFQGLGVEYKTRVQRYEEQIDVLRRLWTEEVVSIRGGFHTIDRAGINPPPTRRPIPIWMGSGTARASLERVGRMADGWIAMGAPSPELRDCWDTIVDAAKSAGRKEAEIGLQGTAQPGGDHTTVRAFPAQDETAELATLCEYVEVWKALGATHVSVSGFGIGRSFPNHLRFVTRAGAALGIS